MIIEEKKGTFKAIKFCRDGLSLIFEEIKGFDIETVKWTVGEREVHNHILI